VCNHNEKMLPRSYSIAGWQQWLCITVDTVWCITTTTGSEYQLWESCSARNSRAEERLDALDRGPDFAERALVQSSTALTCDVRHTARYYFVVDFG